MNYLALKLDPLVEPSALFSLFRGVVMNQGRYGLQSGIAVRFFMDFKAGRELGRIS